VIETNPNAVSIAAQLDNERRSGRIRGLLHGIPVLLKDNIATDDNMQTTAGSLALVNSRVPGDAPIVARLRAAGAVVLGKSNLSEWANFRGDGSINGWSARGGFTRNPYLLSFDPCGSSTGSAVGTAANLCGASVGTETSGSILCPSSYNQVVGLKPTVGLVSQDRIIPIAHSWDTAGPITRSVADAAILLGTLQTPFGQALGQPLPSDYTVYLHRGALSRARIGVDLRYFTGVYAGDADAIAVAEAAIGAIKKMGATILLIDTGDVYADVDSFVNIIIYEFKAQITQYLAALRHTEMRTLADLIAFNKAHCEAEMKYFGQESFEYADTVSGDLNDPVYLTARQNMKVMLGAFGIGPALRKYNLDAVLTPGAGAGGAPAALAGYPSISVPAGVRPDGTPVGVWMAAGFLQEPKLLALAYDLEQELKARKPPAFLGSVPPLPPDAGICEALSASKPGRDNLRPIREPLKMKPPLLCCGSARVGG
jgi:amidase